MSGQTSKRTYDTFAKGQPATPPETPRKLRRLQDRRPSTVTPDKTVRDFMSDDPFATIDGFGKFLERADTKEAASATSDPLLLRVQQVAGQGNRGLTEVSDHFLGHVTPYTLAVSGPSLGFVEPERRIELVDAALGIEDEDLKAKAIAGLALGARFLAPAERLKLVQATLSIKEEYARAGAIAGDRDFDGNGLGTAFQYLEREERSDIVKNVLAMKDPSARATAISGLGPALVHLLPQERSDLAKAIYAPEGLDQPSTVPMTPGQISSVAIRGFARGLDHLDDPDDRREIVRMIIDPFHPQYIDQTNDCARALQNIGAGLKGMDDGERNAIFQVVANSSHRFALHRQPDVGKAVAGLSAGIEHLDRDQQRRLVQIVCNPNHSKALTDSASRAQALKGLCSALPHLDTEERQEVLNTVFTDHPHGLDNADDMLLVISGLAQVAEHLSNEERNEIVRITCNPTNEAIYGESANRAVAISALAKKLDCFTPKQGVALAVAANHIQGPKKLPVLQSFGVGHQASWDRLVEENAAHALVGFSHHQADLQTLTPPPSNKKPLYIDDSTFDIYEDASSRHNESMTFGDLPTEIHAAIGRQLITSDPFEAHQGLMSWAKTNKHYRSVIQSDPMLRRAHNWAHAAADFSDAVTTQTPSSMSAFAIVARAPHLALEPVENRDAVGLSALQQTYSEDRSLAIAGMAAAADSLKPELLSAFVKQVISFDDPADKALAIAGTNSQSSSRTIPCDGLGKALHCLTPTERSDLVKDVLKINDPYQKAVAIGGLCAGLEHLEVEERTSLAKVICDPGLEAALTDHEVGVSQTSAAVMTKVWQKLNKFKPEEQIEIAKLFFDQNHPNFIDHPDDRAIVISGMGSGLQHLSSGQRNTVFKIIARQDHPLALTSPQGIAHAIAGIGAGMEYLAPDQRSELVKMICDPSHPRALTSSDCRAQAIRGLGPALEHLLPEERSELVRVALDENHPHALTETGHILVAIAGLGEGAKHLSPEERSEMVRVATNPRHPTVAATPDGPLPSDASTVIFTDARMRAMAIAGLGKSQECLKPEEHIALVVAANHLMHDPAEGEQSLLDRNKAIAMSGLAEGSKRWWAHVIEDKSAAMLARGEQRMRQIQKDLTAVKILPQSEHKQLEHASPRPQLDNRLQNHVR